MPAHAGAVPRLQHGFHIGGIGLSLGLRRKSLNARSLHDEVRAAPHDSVAGPAPGDAAGESAVVRSSAQLAHSLDESVALRHWIERRGGPERQRKFAAVFDRIDHDHLSGACHATGLHRSQSDRPGAENDHIASRLKVHVCVTGGKARRQLIAEQRELRGRQVGEDRHAVLLEGDHELAYSSDTCLCVYRSAVRKLSKRRKRLDSLCVREERELAVVWTTLQALVALAALRRARDDDPIADLDTLHHRADGLDDAEATVVRHLRSCNRVGAERAAHDRVAGRDSQGADHHLPRVDRQQPHLLNVECAGVADEAAERPTRLRARHDGRCLGGLGVQNGRALQEARACAERRRACLQHMPACQAAFVARPDIHIVLPRIGLTSL